VSNQAKELFEFGPFRLDPEKRLLLRDHQPVPLPLKAFETLLVLVRHSEEVVLKEELMQAVWPDSFVEESNLAQNIFVLRKTLSSLVAEQHYIATIPGRGYRFTEKVRVIVANDALVLQHHSRTRVVIDEDIPQPATVVASPVSARDPVSSRTRSVRLPVALSTLLVVGLATYFLRPTVPPPRITRIQQLTQIGTLVHNTQLLTDGPRVYFRVWQGTERVLRSVSTEGGDVTQVPMPIPVADLNGVSPSGSEFLAVDLEDFRRTEGAGNNPYPRVWRVPIPSGSPQPVGEVHAHEAVWSPDGHAIAYSFDSKIYRVNLDGSDPRKLATLADDPFYLAWAPDGKQIRFSAGDSRTAGYFLWQADLSSNTLDHLIPSLPASARPWAGGWTPDGRYFFYSAFEDGARNIYAIREKSELFSRVNHQPVQLTNGPLTFYLPLPSRDGKRLFAVGEHLRGQLLRYDINTRRFSPFAHGISADHFAFSPDSQWMAYVEFPEGTLVRSRLDGSDRRQLTFPPMHAYSPRWSPDGSQIAFHASPEPGSLEKIYLVSSNGGSPALAGPPSDDRETYLSWSSDGASIVFSASDAAQSTSELRILDLKTRHTTSLPDTTDLYDPQLSPNNRKIIALKRQGSDLVLYDIADHTRRHLTELADYPHWSQDGKFVYFNTQYFNAKGRTGGVYRWNALTNAIEAVAKYPDFLLTGAFGVDFAITPDGAVLMLKDISNRDLYALDLDLP